MIIHDRPDTTHPRHPREGGPNPSRPTSWKAEGGMSTDKRETRVERPERSGREVSGHSVRGAPPGTRSNASGYGNREPCLGLAGFLGSSQEETAVSVKDAKHVQQGPMRSEESQVL